MAEAFQARHDRLARQFMSEIVAEAIHAGDGFGELMALLETCVFGALLAGERCHKVSRRVSVEVLQAMTDAVLDRLAKEPVRHSLDV
jgi:hypothetical protein